MKKIILTIMILASLFGSISFASGVIGISPSIRTPDDIANWFASEFTYEMKFPDRPQSPEETLDLKKGDCDDFATLASAILSNLGVKSEVYIIKYKGLNIYHAVCLWQNKRGTYSMISTQAIYHTLSKDVVSAIEEQYPDWEKLILSNMNRDHVKVITR